MLPKLLTSIFGSRNDRLLKQYRQVVAKINALEPQFEALDDAALTAKTQRLPKSPKTSEVWRVQFHWRASGVSRMVLSGHAAEPGG